MVAPKGATATGSPETEPNYKSICRQLQQKNNQLGKAYQDLKAQFDELEGSCQEREEQLAQAQQDADEMADMVCQNEERLIAYTEQLRVKYDRIKALEKELRTLKNSSEPSANHEAGTARNMISDFLGIAELQIVNEVTYQSTLERLGDLKLSVKG